MSCRAPGYGLEAAGCERLDRKQRQMQQGSSRLLTDCSSPNRSKLLVHADCAGEAKQHCCRAQDLQAAQPTRDKGLGLLSACLIEPGLLKGEPASRVCKVWNRLGGQVMMNRAAAAVSAFCSYFWGFQALQLREMHQLHHVMSV